jgi:hypothetical protein
MSSLVLRYEWNLRTGLPALRVPPGTLTPQEQRALESELARRYNHLVERPDGPCRLRTRTRLAPNGRFVLRVRTGHPRLPTLLLTPFRPAAIDPLEEWAAAILLG